MSFIRCNVSIPTATYRLDIHYRHGRIASFLPFPPLLFSSFSLYLSCPPFLPFTALPFPSFPLNLARSLGSAVIYPAGTGRTRPPNAFVQYLVQICIFCTYGLTLFVAALRSRCGHWHYFRPVVCSSFPRLILAVTDWMSTIVPHMVWP